MIAVWYGRNVQLNAESQQELERLQNYSMRLILSQPLRTPNDGLRKVIKWMTLKKKRKMVRL